MEIKDMSIEEIETRSLEIENLLTDDNADVDALSEEVKALEERKAFLLAEVEERKKKVDEVMNAPAIENTEKEEVRKKMNLTELRNSEQYINAYANYIKTGKDVECRKLISELADPENIVANTDGVVPVPTIIEDRIQTAWNNSEILKRVPKIFGVGGQYKVGFELSADPANYHAEGDADGVPEEKLLLGIVTIHNVTLKKWLRVTDEVLSYKGRVFLDYLYDEIEYQIVKLAEDAIVNIIASSPTTSTATVIGVPQITVDATNAPDVFTLAYAELSDEARDPVIIMHKKTYAYFKTLRNSLGARYEDIFDNMPVLFNNSLPEYAGEGLTQAAAIAIVVDLNGVRAVFPGEREEVEFKFDDKTEMEKDIVRILGKMLVGLGLVAPGRACNILADNK